MIKFFGTRVSGSKQQQRREESDEIMKGVLRFILGPGFEFMPADVLDAMEKELPPLKTFILPGGHPAGAALHLARSISRRAERLVLPIHLHADASNHVLVYLNRLSDYLFVMSRYINHLVHSPETLWEHHKKI